MKCPGDQTLQVGQEKGVEPRHCCCCCLMWIKKALWEPRGSGKERFILPTTYLIWTEKLPNNPLLAPTPSHLKLNIKWPNYKVLSSPVMIYYCKPFCSVPRSAKVTVLFAENNWKKGFYLVWAVSGDHQSCFQSVEMIPRTEQLALRPQRSQQINSWFPESGISGYQECLALEGGQVPVPGVTGVTLLL